MSAPPNSESDPKAVTTLMVGLIGTLMLLAILLYTVALFYSTQRRQIEAKVYSRPFHEVAQLRSEQQEKLASFGWVNASAGVAAIPIQRAMQLTVADLKSGRRPVTIKTAGVDAAASGPTTQSAATQPAGPGP